MATDETGPGTWFPNGVQDYEAIKSKVVHEFAGVGPARFLILEGPQLWVTANEAYVWPASEPLILSGAGNWALGDKGQKALATAPERSMQCKFQSDEDKVLLEVNGRDNPVMSLKAALQAVERGGLVDFQLGGHTCTRPAAVVQGQTDDKLLWLHLQQIVPVLASCVYFKYSVCIYPRFDVAPNDDDPAVWKPNTVRLDLVKHSNAGSYFATSVLTSSPAVRVTWRIRAYTAEKPQRSPSTTPRQT